MHTIETVEVVARADGGYTVLLRDGRQYYRTEIPGALIHGSEEEAR